MSKVTISNSTLNGKMTVPGSKSHTIRAILLSALAEGESHITNPLRSGDGLAARTVARAFGAKINEDNTNNILTISGLNGKLSTPSNIIYTANSGTSTSFAIGLAALAPGYSVITGDEQICSRPWKTETDALKALGATVIHTRPSLPSPPIVIGGPIRGGDITIEGFNSQHVSGLLLPAPLLSSGEVLSLHVTNPLETPYVQMTIDYMERFGAKLEYTPDYTFFKVEGGQSYKERDITVPADWSSVAFPLVAALITDSKLTITGLDFNDVQGDKAVVDILISMGADIIKDKNAGSLTIKGGTTLHGLDEIDMTSIPDSLPALSIAAAYAKGDTLFTHLAHVRVKESDRVAKMSAIINSLGGSAQITADTMLVHGGIPLHGGKVESAGDHRIAMAMTICGLACSSPLTVNETDCANVSYPGFYDSLKSLGADIDTSAL